MSNDHSDETPDDVPDDAGSFDWNEFDWERYLQDRDRVVIDYWQRYVQVGLRPDRIDEVASLLGWALPEDEDDLTSGAETDDDSGPYTVHSDRVFVAARAIFGGLRALVERFGGDPERLPAAAALSLLGALHEAEIAAVLGIHALDLGDPALGISQMKRALARLNSAFALLPPGPASAGSCTPDQEFSSLALPLLFDLREIFLRVSSGSRDDLQRQIGEDEEF